MKKYKITRTFTYEGKRYYIYGNSEMEVAEKMVRKKMELESGVVVSSNMLLRDWAEECLDTYKQNQADITREKYVSRMNSSILTYIGDMPLSKIKAIDCQKVLNYQADNSQRQINEVYQIMNFLLGKAKDNKLINENPAANLIKPKGYVKERRALTKEEESHMVPLLSNERFWAFALMYYCGVRPSEARECKYEDILEKNGKKLLHVRGTKNKNADRFVPFPNELGKIIGEGKGYIATDTRGKKHSTTSFRKAWLQLIKQMNISMGCETFKGRVVEPVVDPDLVPYTLRHTFVSSLIQKYLWSLYRDNDRYLHTHNRRQYHRPSVGYNTGYNTKVQQNTTFFNNYVGYRT